MLAAINFDDEALFKADKIDNVWTNRLLSAELVTSKLAKPKVFPQDTFSICHVFS